jgi:hypothetical protein
MMIIQGSKVSPELKKEIENRIKELLETKHLYQSVRISDAAIQSLISQAANDPGVKNAIRDSNTGFYDDRSRIIAQHNDGITIEGKRILEGEWVFSAEECAKEEKYDPLGHKTLIRLPTILVPCLQCGGSIQPHNSGFRGQKSNFDVLTWSSEKLGSKVLMQTYMLPYHCQACKGEPLVFLVRREGLKLTLVGRNHFESPQVPKTIPKEEAKFLGEAIVASNTGSTLAGLFLLRTTIEQYMRRVTGTTAKLSGDELAEQYATLLAGDFPKSRYPSLKTVYDELSACLHEAVASAEQFNKSRADIEKHFSLLEHFPLIPKTTEHHAK